MRLPWYLVQSVDSGSRRRDNETTVMQKYPEGFESMENSHIARESYTIRQVSSIEELREAFAVIGAQVTPPITPGDRGLDALIRNYPQDQSLMLVVEQDGRIIGGALGFRSTLRILALEPSVRGKGLGRRLLQTFEIATMRRGVRAINLGAEEEKGFYLRMGYRGKSSLHKELPTPSRVLDLRPQRLEPLTGNLAVGQVVATDVTAKIPSLL